MGKLLVRLEPIYCYSISVSWEVANIRETLCEAEEAVSVDVFFMHQSMGMKYVPNPWKRGNDL